MKKPKGAIKFCSRKNVWWYGWRVKRGWKVKPVDWPKVAPPVKDWLNASRQYARIREREKDIPRPIPLDSAGLRGARKASKSDIQWIKKFWL